MHRTQIIAFIIYAAILLIYIAIASRDFKKGWITTGIPVKGGKLNGLVFIIVCTVVLILIVTGTIHG
jgi:hypothetical protein